MAKWKRPEYKRVNHLWETRYLGKDPSPNYEVAISPKVGGFRAAEKALYMKRMSEVFKKVKAEHPLVKTSLVHRNGKLFLHLEEHRPGDFEIEKRFIRMGERLKKLEEAESKRIWNQKLRFEESEMDAEDQDRLQERVDIAISKGKKYR